MLMKNSSQDVVRIKIGKGVVVFPDQTVEIADHLCQPQVNQTGSARKSIIEMYAPQMVPVSGQITTYSDHSAPKQQSIGIPSVEQLMSLGTPKGVAVAMVQQALASEQEKLKLYHDVEIKQIKQIAKEVKEVKKDNKEVSSHDIQGAVLVDGAIKKVK